MIKFLLTYNDLTSNLSQAGLIIIFLLTIVVDIHGQDNEIDLDICSNERLDNIIKGICENKSI